MKRLGFFAAFFVSALPYGGYGQTIPVETSPTVAVTTAAVERVDAESTAGGAQRESGLEPQQLMPADPLASQTATVAFNPETMMPVDDIRPGMKGYGLSVFSGLEPERFEAEVIGVRHRMMAGTDIILCRLKSPHLVDLGVIAGMSGSPVYVDDKLIGAVAYGFLDVDDPLAGVTPIADMLDVYNSTPVEPATGPEDSASGPGFETFKGYMALKENPTMENLRKVAMPASSWQSVQVRAAEFGSDIAERYGLPAEFTMQPLSSPIVVNGGNPLTAELARSIFKGMDVVSGGQEMSGVSTWSPSAIAPNSPGGPLGDLTAFSDKISGGYALAVPFIEGDLNMAGVGTVSWREGNRLVAFGHPMFQNGTVYFPMAAARINALVRSRTRPFKLGEPVGHVGMVRQDRLPAIGGLFGQTAKMFPVSATIVDPQYSGERAFQFRIFNDRRMTPGLIMTALGESLGAAARSGGDSAALFGYSFKLDDGTSITKEDYVADTAGTLMAAFGAMADTGVLLNNPFKPVDMEQLEFRMQVIDKLRQASIESAVLDKQDYQPGETAAVEFLLRPFREEPVRMTYSFIVPDVLPDGDYEVVVSDGDSRESLEGRRNPGGEKLNNFDDVVRAVKQNFASNRVYISLVDKDTGVSVQGSEMPRLPGSVINMVQDTVNSQYFAPVRGNFVVDADVSTNYEINGQTNVTLKVRRSVEN